MFLGHYQHSLDDKGRVSIPAPFRKAMAGFQDQKLVLTRGNDPCLMAFTMTSWQALIDKVAQLPMMSPEVKAFERLFAGHAFEAVIDRPGRILVPPYLREYARLEDHAVFVGRIAKFEIWRPEQWQEAQRQSSETLNSSDERIATLV